MNSPFAPTPTSRSDRARILCLGLTLLLPSLVLAADAPAGAAKLPSGREVVDRHIKAIGGKEAILKPKSLQFKGKFEMPAQGISGDLTVWIQRASRVRIKITIPAVGEILTGYGDGAAWSVDPAMGPRLLEGKEAEQTKRASDWADVLHEGPEVKTLETVELTPFEGRDCYKVRLVRSTGDEEFEFYDAKTGLKAGGILTAGSAMGDIKTTTIEQDYKTFGGVQFPTKLVQRMMNIEQVMTLDAIEFDKVPDDVFKTPESIQALLKK